MDVRKSQTPAFGRADLSNCEREQIHLAGSIQPHGALLVLREPELVVIQTSKNACALLQTKELVGRHVRDVGGTLFASLLPHLSQSLRALPVSFRATVGRASAAFDALMHRSPDGGLILELEPAGPKVDIADKIDHALQSVLAASSLPSLCEEAASFFKSITGYDRVMVYRFDDEGHGEVFAERRRRDLEPYLGNRYPASDIPQIARRLYEHNRVRLLVDVDYAPVPITPRLSPLTGKDLDMSLCWLRSMSPIHVQYLKNMGVGATLVVSLVVGGKLWGLIACHHYAPRHINFEIRTACELLAEMIATRLAALESFAQAQAELSVRRLEQRMMEAIAREGDWRTALFDASQALLQLVDATGVALLFEGQVLTGGDVPATQHLRELGEWLDTKARDTCFATTSLAADAAEFGGLTPVASGVLATPLSKSHGEYLVWFRPEQVRTVTWGGDPHKPMVIGENPEDLSPRRSFAKWHQVVEGTCEPWTASDLIAARLLGETLVDVVVQFRSVRLLIAQHQVEQVSHQLLLSDNAVIVTDSRGQILLTNEAFDRLLPAGHAHLQMVEDITPFLHGPPDVRRELRDLLGAPRPWRSEVSIAAGGGKTPVMVRADPVFSAPDRLLGFVFLFTHLTQRRAAETARRAFQEGMTDPHGMTGLRRDSINDPAYRNLIGSVQENAQLAAMEITESADTTLIPKLLDSVQASAVRAAELLQHLVAHHAGRDEK